MDHHQLVVVQNEVVELRHADEGVVAYPRQAIAADQSGAERRVIELPPGNKPGVQRVRGV